jgi:CubicO group peptidase (beta-lactamase class C family)
MTKTAIDQETATGHIQGSCDPNFAGVADAFIENFASQGEVGASACVTVDGETVVDIWGGTANAETNAPWQKDSISTVFSCTKGATALCAHILISRGLLDIDGLVADYWPEYATNGKEETTVRMMLDHTSGVPVTRGKLKQGAFHDWDYMVDQLANQEPFWQPGTRSSYHAFTFGWTVGELVRRVSGRSLGTFFQDEIAKPLGIDFWIGLPEEQEPRVAPLIPPAGAPDGGDPMFRAFLADPESVSGLVITSIGENMAPGCNSRADRAAEIGGANGTTNGRGLAGMYAPLACGGALNGVKLVDADTLAGMGATSAGTHQDGSLQVPVRFAAGYMKSMDNRRNFPGDFSCLMGAGAFGHVGYGGSIGMADPGCRMSLGYTMNNMGAGVLLNARGQAIVDETYKALGYRSNKGGTWIK